MHQEDFEAKVEAQEALRTTSTEKKEDGIVFGDSAAGNFYMYKEDTKNGSVL